MYYNGKQNNISGIASGMLFSSNDFPIAVEKLGKENFRMGIFAFNALVNSE